MGPEPSAWFTARPDSAVGDFFALCEDSADAMQASIHALEQVGGILPAGTAALQLADARERLRRAQRGDWRPYEDYLRTLGSTHARTALRLYTWHGIANAFHEPVVARAVALYAAQPARLTAVLLVLGEFIERTLAIIGNDYYEAKHQRERQVSARYRSVIEGALDPVIEVDERGIITEFNRAAERTFGYAQADARGRALDALLVPPRPVDQQGAGPASLVDHPAATLGHVLVTGEGYPAGPGKRCEFTVRRADGSELQVELTRVAVDRLDGGKAFLGFLRDVSEQQRADESMAMRDHALEQAHFGIVVSDPESRHITSVNPAYARIVGYEPDELIGTSGARLVPPGTEGVIEEIARKVEDRGHHTYEVRLLRKDGTTVPVLASTTTVEPRAGARRRISTVIDMSQLEQARATARQIREHSAARLEILASAAHEFAALSGNIEQLLAAVARRLSEIVGDGCAIRLISRDGAWLEPSGSFFHPDPEIRALVKPVLATARQRVGEGLSGRVAATGTAELVPEIDTAQMIAQSVPAFEPALARAGVSSALGVPLRSRGRTIGVITLLRNRPGRPYTIEDQHLTQELADRAGLAIDNAVLVATLEHRVSERTAELEAVNRELEAFSYSVSHDLRTPLRAIDGFSQVLLGDYEATLDNRAKHYLTRIRAGTQRMAALIDDLLNLARITRVSLDLGIHDLSALAADVAAELHRREPARTTRIHITPELRARVDARMLRIVFDNLLGNAWKFTAKHDDAEIWFGADGDTFYVRDTGAGFDMAYAEKLFVPFQRLHAVKEYEGTGVGLATVQRIVTRHGGRIWAEAAVGKGATFYFTLGDQHGRAIQHPAR